MRPVSSLTSFVVSGLLAVAGTLFVGWPSVVDAEAPEAEAAQAGSAEAVAVNAPQNAQLRANESKIGELVVSADLAEPQPGRHVVRLECQNPTAMLIAGNVHLEMGRNDGIPMGRVEPPPSIVWQRNEAVKVPAGETVVREITLPTQFSKEMNRLAKLRSAAENNPNIVPPYVYYSAMAYPVVPNSVENPSNRLASRSRMNSLALAPAIPVEAPVPIAAPDATPPTDASLAKANPPAIAPAAQVAAQPQAKSSVSPSRINSEPSRPRLSAKSKMSSLTNDVGF
jgi:hypothetical protein